MDYSKDAYIIYTDKTGKKLRLTFDEYIILRDKEFQEEYGRSFTDMINNNLKYNNITEG